ncbi:MAG: type II toxin-antitoxin system toxin DhiT [Methylobacter sp.]
MPVISMFYGIIIRLYLMDNKHHNTPHIHARYAEFEASIDIADGEILSGELPRKQLRLVQAWIELHRDELMADWDLAVSGENPYKIAPL